ncbi:MAG TPA: right-handed parallel beta-helix repeat-containing protein [Thermoanaerobaculia bacterium]|nr:right-handed parallel beta-helix repeat-containing protein [Thermoanaerobaculia bacterium]
MISRGALTLALFATLLAATAAWANHPVLLEGNCDSPVPGTTLVGTGKCGDWDGDGRVGAAEDGDGADRIFGTIEAALGAGMSGSGINLNGTITIVTSGRFVPSSTVRIGDAPSGPTNVTIEAAPGVTALFDAVLQGDPAGGNTLRQNIAGILVDATGDDDRIVFRNLTIQNWVEGIRVTGGARVTIDNCRFEHNLNYAVRAMGTSLVIVYESTITDTGTRGGSGVSNFGVPGRAVSYEESARGMVARSQIFNSKADAVTNESSLGTSAVFHHQVVISGNGGGIVNATPIGF